MLSIHRCTPAVVAAVVLAFLAACSGAPRAAEPRPPARDARAQRIHARWVAELDTAIAHADRLASYAKAGVLDRSALVASFRASRLAYKRSEFLSAYYTPTTVETINGPALPGVDEEEGAPRVIEPEGYQVVEPLLFPSLVADSSARLATEAAILAANLRRLAQFAKYTTLSDRNVFDAVRQELARIGVLGLTGLDSPVALASIDEARASLDGVRQALGEYAPDLARRDAALAARLAALADSTARDLGEVAFADLDRLRLLTDRLNPLAHLVAAARDRLGIPVPDEVRAWRAAAPTLFEREAFDAAAFAPHYAEGMTPARVALGRALFAAPVLSGNGTRSCASCHRPDRAWTDGRARSEALTRGAPLRNAPTILNASLQAGVFYDLRAAYLEDQVADVVRNRDEMHGDEAAAARRLAADPAWRARFAQAFGEAGDSTVTALRIRRALAAWERTLVALDSPFDRYMRGDRAALTPEQQAGFNLFMGKAKCGTCHFAPLFSGTVPPAFTESEMEVLGVPSRPVTRGATVDPDLGRARVNGVAIHRYMFRTPTLRNVALTAPYMHNGVYRTLDEVVDFYNRGGGAGIGIALPNQTLPPEPLELTREEQRAVVAFMRALTDTVAAY